MRFAIILILTWLLIVVFKKMGITQLKCGLLSGFLGSLFTHVILVMAGESAKSALFSSIMFTAAAVIIGYFISRKVYGLPPLFEDE